MASSMDKKRILERTFDTARLKYHVSTILLLPYIPLGCFLAILRFCLLMNFLIARTLLRLFLTGDGIIMSKITQLFMIILGINVRLHGKRLPTEIIVCNRRCSLDGFIISHLLDVFAINKWNLPTYVLRPLQLCSKEPGRVGKGPPMILFPERYSTTGQCLTPFDPWYLQGTTSVQPAAIMYWRPLPLSLSTIGSCFLGDLFWMFFVPFTTVDIFLSSDCVYCTKDNSTQTLSSAIERVISEMLKKPILDISLKRLSQYIGSLTPLPDHKIDPSMLLMVKKVEEVTPHVPRNVIIADLKKTKSVDVTLANIFEGVVDFIPVNTRTFQLLKTKPNNLSQQSRRLTPFEQRKAELMETARQRYKEKHGL